MHKERVTIEGDRYLIFYTFTGVEDAESRPKPAPCEPRLQPQARREKPAEAGEGKR